MNSIRTYLILPVLFLCLVINTMPAASQEPAATVPAGAQTAEAPPGKQGAMRVPAMERASFTVKISEKPAKNSAGAVTPPTSAPPKGAVINQPVEIEVTRFMPVQRNNVTWSNGAKTEDWFTGKYFLKKSPDGNWINTFDVDSDVLVVAQYAFTLRHFFAWINPTTFVDSGTRNGQPANHFRRGEAGAEAWIHAETGMPLEYVEGSKVYTYTFGPPPTTAPELSPAHAKELARYLQTAKVPRRISSKQ